MTKVLVIDDDKRLRELLSTYLEENGIATRPAADGERGLAALKQEAFDAVILDVMMPGLDGLEVLRRIRRDSSVPVIMLTAKGDEMDRVIGLEIGADDYVAKPFGPRELLARLRAVLRRFDGAAVESARDALRHGGVTVNLATREVWDGERQLELTGLEFELLVVLMRKAGRVVSREMLLRETGRDDVYERAIDVHISHLRQKLADEGARRIKTVRGVGYVFTRDGVGAAADGRER